MLLQASVILLTGGCLPECMLGYIHIPLEQTPPWSRHSPGADMPPGADTLPPGSRHSPLNRHAPLGADTPPPGVDPPPGADTSLEQTPPPRSRHAPPPWRACWEIRSTRGRYASYWNAILLAKIFPSMGQVHF